MYLQVGASPWKQSISKKRASRFVILSESEESLARQRFFALAQNDSLRTASFDSQHVLFEMDCPQGDAPTRIALSSHFPPKDGDPRHAYALRPIKCAIIRLTQHKVQGG